MFASIASSGKGEAKYTLTATAWTINLVCHYLHRHTRTRTISHISEFRGVTFAIYTVRLSDIIKNNILHGFQWEGVTRPPLTYCAAGSHDPRCNLLEVGYRNNSQCWYFSSNIMMTEMKSWLTMILIGMYSEKMKPWVVNNEFQLQKKYACILHRYMHIIVGTQFKNIRSHCVWYT